MTPGSWLSLGHHIRAERVHQAERDITRQSITGQAVWSTWILIWTTEIHSAHKRISSKSPMAKESSLQSKLRELVVKLKTSPKLWRRMMRSRCPDLSPNPRARTQPQLAWTWQRRMISLKCNLLLIQKQRQLLMWDRIQLLQSVNQFLTVDLSLPAANHKPHLWSQTLSKRIPLSSKSRLSKPTWIQLANQLHPSWSFRWTRASLAPITPPLSNSLMWSLRSLLMPLRNPRREARQTRELLLRDSHNQCKEDWEAHSHPCRPAKPSSQSPK